MFKLNEIFLPLHGFEGSDILSERYRISNYGNIYDILNYKFCKLSLCGKPEYYYITLVHKDIRKTLRVNRLVALSFIDNPNNLPVCDHIDRDRLNNYYKNLRWVTRRQNNKNSDYYDNAGNNFHNKQKRMKYKGVINNKGKYYISLKSKYYGSCDDEEIAGKVFDVISVYNNFKAVNFPDENLLCEYENIYDYINPIIKNNNRYICEDLKNKIKYKYKNEYCSKKYFIDKYHLSYKQLNNIISDIIPKIHKPKFNSCDVKSIYLKSVIIDKYLNGEHSRKKIAEDLKHLGCTVRRVDHALKDTPRMGRKESLPLYLRKEIYKVHLSGLSISDCCKLYDISKDMMSNIKRKFKCINIEDL